MMEVFASFLERKAADVNVAVTPHVSNVAVPPREKTTNQKAVVAQASPPAKEKTKVDWEQLAKVARQVASFTGDPWYLDTATSGHVSHEEFDTEPGSEVPVNTAGGLSYSEGRGTYVWPFLQWPGKSPW